MEVQGEAVVVAAIWDVIAADYTLTTGVTCIFSWNTSAQFLTHLLMVLMMMIMMMMMMMMMIIIIIIIVVVFVVVVVVVPLCSLFTIIYLKQTMFLGYLMSQLFCGFSMWYM